MCGEPHTPGLQAGYDPETRCQVRGSIAIRYIVVIDSLLEEIRAAGFIVFTQWILDTVAEQMLILSVERLQQG
jgi:hypothetical protein